MGKRNWNTVLFIYHSFPPMICPVFYFLAAHICTKPILLTAVPAKECCVARADILRTTNDPCCHQALCKYIQYDHLSQFSWGYFALKIYMLLSISHVETQLADKS